MTMKCVIYARVSSKEQEETGYSLPAQEKFLKEYAAKKEFDIPKVFAISESASGAKQRQVFKAMMDYMDKHAIKIVVCEKVDRLTRNFKDAVAIDDWLDADEERQVHLVKDSLVLHKNSRSQERLNWGIRLIFARNYIDNLKEEVRKGYDEKLRQGGYPAKPPIGYTTVGEKGHKVVVVDQARAPLVIKMFELYASGNYSLKALEQCIYDMGLRNDNGRRIYKSRLCVLLSHPFYVGIVRFKGKLYDNATHEPLIDRQLFDRVQELLHGKTTPKYSKHNPVFKGKIYCANCNGLVTWELQKKRYWYGHCNYNKTCPGRKFVRENLVFEQLMPYFDQVTLKSNALAEAVKEALKELHQEKIVFSNAERESLSQQLKVLENRMDNMYVDKLDGKISESKYEEKVTEFKAESKAIEQRLATHNNANAKYYEFGPNVLELARRSGEIFSNPNRTIEQRRNLLSQLFSNLTLNGEKLEVNYDKAFAKLLEYVPEWNEAVKKFELDKNSVDKTQNTQELPECSTWLG